jgi:hypothetical protein
MKRLPFNPIQSLVGFMSIGLPFTLYFLLNLHSFTPIEVPNTVECLTWNKEVFYRESNSKMLPIEHIWTNHSWQTKKENKSTFRPAYDSRAKVQAITDEIVCLNEVVKVQTTGTAGKKEWVIFDGKQKFPKSDDFLGYDQAGGKTKLLKVVFDPDDTQNKRVKTAFPY